MEPSFPIVRHPSPGNRNPVLVSVPHYGTEALPHITCDDYSEPWFETFAYGFADTFVGDLYGELHEHGATVLATPFSRMFVDVNRRRADVEARLQALYDPYYAALEHLLGQLRHAYGYAILLDGHTGSPRRMKDHQVIIGTRHDATCAPQLAAA